MDLLLFPKQNNILAENVLVYLYFTRFYTTKDFVKT